MSSVLINAKFIFILKLLPGVKVVIANPETKGHCADSHLGEVKNICLKLYFRKNFNK